MERTYKWQKERINLVKWIANNASKWNKNLNDECLFAISILSVCMLFLQENMNNIFEDLVFYWFLQN
jgi:hypothetical protein